MSNAVPAAPPHDLEPDDATTLAEATVLAEETAHPDRLPAAMALGIAALLLVCVALVLAAAG